MDGTQNIEKLNFWNRAHDKRKQIGNLSLTIPQLAAASKGVL